MNELNQVKNKKSFAPLIAVAVCAILIIAAILISILNPSTPFDIPGLDPHGKTHYKDMEYKRVDVEALLNDIDELHTMIDEKSSFSKQRDLFQKIDSALGDYYTMSALMEIKFFSDPTNEEYSAEYNYLDGFSAQVSDKVYELMDAISVSSQKSSYERNFFGIGYFNGWESRDYSDEVVALMEEESRITNKYLEEIADPSVTLSSGVTVKISDVDFSSITQAQYNDILNAYRLKFAQMYVDIVKIRLEIAEKSGVDYDRIAYKNLGREYYPDQVEAYIEGVALNIIPLYYELQYSSDAEAEFVDPLTSFSQLKDGAYAMGGEIAEAFDYMLTYGLYDMSYSEKKSAISFQTYLTNYNSPFIFVSPRCDNTDLLTFSHEFGHFVDAYYNLQTGITIDNTEIASQAMALILPLYAEGQLSDNGYDYLKAGLRDVLETFLHTSLTGLFEQKVYRLSPDEVTVERLDAIAAECAEELGVDDENASTFSSFWFETQHIFIAPMYTIGYAVSCDVALQVLELELKDPRHGGANAYMNVIDRDLTKTFSEDIGASGFASPFGRTRLENTAQFIRDAFEGKYQNRASEQ